ncbi:sodium:calcium antiporter [Stenotrophobium rhamnosiphilum]|uniref:Sodium:proton exchanger n=1 Tax=Stenotrophobium rhamnosiphilum TaxID=2029166 RepID=A0A2T5MG40_9GAMM|nr:sodium:calcium antiporter [Stenotrophobium rhamnosiphilum]PTU31544.1 sodium:proton exchanger [Stenotrophobium rhamnosiphilum]
MILLCVELVVMLLVILAAAEIFTNALEHLGERLGISEGVTGSLFAAVGTALPETLVPIIAIYAGTQNMELNHDIGVGAILGAPLMLSTLSTALMAISVLRLRGIKGRIAPERSGFVRDLNFFLFAFLIAAAAMYVPTEMREARIALSASLVGLYLAYIVVTVRASSSLVDAGHGTEAEEPIFLTKFGFKENLGTIILQLILAVLLLVGGAKGFINGIEGVSTALGISALVLSLLIIPIATELPEKVNSILWVRRGKDTLAFGNITGAMVFQGTLLPALGILVTPWTPRPEVLSGIVITLVAAAWLRLNATATGPRIAALLLNGGLYLCYLAYVLL